MKRIILTLTLALFTLPILNAQDLPSYVPTDGLVAYYPFNGNANDASGSGHHGTVNGATLSSDRDGNENSSYSFDGIDDDISNSNEFLPLNIDFTISVWFNTNDIYQGSQCILNSLEHTGIGLVFNHNYNSSKMNLFLGDGISFWDVDGLGGMKSDYQNDTWYNIILTKQNDLYKVYLNGVVDIETNISNSLNYNNLVGFRFGTISPDSGYEQFFGKLDDIGFWNRALTVQEIQNLYTSSNGDILLNGVVSAENNQIKNVADPVDGKDAVTKDYLLEKIAQLQDQIDALQASSGSGTVNDQDGNSYPYLTYGDQVWTVKNAEMVTYRDGTVIPQVTDATEWSNLTTGAWCYYDNDSSKGKLYNWYAVAGIHDTDPNTPNKELAPEGWHVPTDAEWTTLEEHLIANGYNYDGTTTENKIAKSMASTTGWNSSTTEGAPGKGQSLNNSSGFNAFPEGARYTETANYGNGSFDNVGRHAFFWSSTETSANYAWYRDLVNDLSRLGRADSYSGDGKQFGFSVRFVRD